MEDKNNEHLTEEIEVEEVFSETEDYVMRKHRSADKIIAEIQIFTQVARKDWKGEEEKMIIDLCELVENTIHAQLSDNIPGYMEDEG